MHSSRIHSGSRRKYCRFYSFAGSWNPHKIVVVGTQLHIRTYCKWLGGDVAQNWLLNPANWLNLIVVRSLYWYWRRKQISVMRRWWPSSCFLFLLRKVEHVVILLNVNIRTTNSKTRDNICSLNVATRLLMHQNYNSWNLNVIDLAVSKTWSWSVSIPTKWKTVFQMTRHSSLCMGLFIKQAMSR